MKKFFSMMLIAAAALSFAACDTITPEGPEPNKPTGNEKLETPVPTAEAGDTFFTVSWEAITGADSYTLNLKGKNYTTAETSYKFENFNAGEYTVRVKAVGEGYKDSDFGSVTVTLTGATDVDWFTVTAQPAAVNEEKGYGPYNAIEFTWKGTELSALAYGLYYTDNLIGVSESDIKKALTEVDADTLADVNSEEGFSGVFGPIDGGTTFSMCLLATNAQGVEFYVVKEVTTETAEPSEAAKAWIGTWEVNSTKVYSINDKGEGTLLDGAETFTVNITPDASDPNYVVIDGWSVLGEGFITYGEVEDNTLYILNGTNLGMSQDGAYYYYWLGWYDFGISIDGYPSNVVTMNGETATSTNQMTFYDENNAEVPVTCFASDVFGVTDAGNIYFLIEAFPGVYRSGDMTWTKKAAAAEAANVDVMGFTPTALKSSVVLR
ncbi:MAG: hypothetical protein J6Q21_00370 [Alistipes sp.]|nr:hypothetical protein [Alistipes sp.]